MLHSVRGHDSFSFDLGGHPLRRAARRDLFSTVIVPHWGLNLLHVVALDDFDNVYTVTQAFYFAEKYHGLDPEVSFIRNALLQYLAPSVIDDGVILSVLNVPSHP